MDAGHRRHAGALQHHDRQLGRPGRSLEQAHGHPQRYTFQFLEESDWFTLSFFSPQWRKQLAHCGAVSGREEDKFAACGFHVADADGAPYVQEADLVLVCQKRYWNDLDPAHMDPEALEHYQAQDYHRMYLGEITQVLRRV